MCLKRLKGAKSLNTGRTADYISHKAFVTSWEKELGPFAVVGYFTTASSIICCKISLSNLFKMSNFGSFKLYHDTAKF